MILNWKRRFTWVDLDDFEVAFLKDPYPERGHRGSLAELKDSILRYGVIQPIIARVHCGKLQVICGYRRWLAAQIARVDRIPVIITRLSDDEAKRLFEEEMAGRWLGLEDLAGDSDDSREESSKREGERRLDVEEEKTVEERLDELDSEAYRLNPMKGANVAAFSRAWRDGITDLSHLVTGQSSLVDADTAESIPIVLRTLEPMSEEALRAEVMAIYLETREIFKLIQSEDDIPVGRVNTTLDRILELEPIARGYDIREVGDESTTAENPEEESIACVAAHSVRVAFLAQHMAATLSWSKKAIECLTLSGLLHDIGMLSIAEAGFYSTFPLTKSRQKVLLTHTSLGKELIDRHWDQSISNVARDHHERWDGTGYPAGKMGNEVEVSSRIIGLLDCYAAMICRRAYRSAYHIQEAIRNVRESTALGLFDPAQERLFMQVFSSVPVGLYGRLTNGTMVRVREVHQREDKSHRLVTSDETTGSTGELWLAEDELLQCLTEVPLMTGIPTTLTAALADIP